MLARRAAGRGASSSCSCLTPFWRGPSSPSTGVLLLLLLLALLLAAVAPALGQGAAGATAAAAQPVLAAPSSLGPAAAGQPVESYEELMAALADPRVSRIVVNGPIQMPAAPPPRRPVVVTRQLLISSPMRAMIDWCDAACRAGAPQVPHIILGQGAMVTFNRLFFRNFIPPQQQQQRQPAPGGNASAPLDYASGPCPFIATRDGAQATFNLVVMHWRRPMLWVLRTPGTFWHDAASAHEVRRVGAPGGLLALPLPPAPAPALYMVKSYASDAGSATVTDCFLPWDLDGCLPADAPFDTTLIYCPYTFKDSLKNPWVDKVLVFHDIGLDRLVNSYRNPTAVNRSVVYTSCPGTRQTIDLDNITSSVLVASGGSLTFRNLVFQGSKSQERVDWPSHISLLLSTFSPVGSGTIVLRDSTVRVTDMPALIRALVALPSGGASAVEVPNLQPSYAGGRPPAPRQDAFTIRLWQLQRQRWALAAHGGSTVMDRLSSTASWQFFNVTAERYSPPDCFAAAIVQGSVAPGAYSHVHTGQQLLDQLGNSSARYIRVMADMSMPDGLQHGQVTVNRIVEIRSCSPTGHTIDWRHNHDVVMVAGNAIWQGALTMRGVGWSQQAIDSNSSQVVDAVHPSGMAAIVEYEDCTLEAEMPQSLWTADSGRGVVAGLLTLRDLESGRPNITSYAPTQLIMRSFQLNRSDASDGADGLESFIDTTLRWREDADGQPRGAGRLTPSQLAAAVAVPVVLGSLLVAGLLLLLARRRRNHRAHAAAADVKASAAAAPGSDQGSPASGSKGGSSSLLSLALVSVFGLGAKGRGGAAGGIGSKQPSSSASEIAAFGVAASDTGNGSTDANSNRDAAAAAAGGGDSHLSRLAVASRTPSATSTSRGGRLGSAGPGEDIAAACKDLAVRREAGPRSNDDLVLESVLGEGSFGKVFRATWRGTAVAVKIMVLPSYALSGKQKREKMAVMETAISSSMSHPNVVSTYTWAIEPVRGNSSQAGVGGGGSGGSHTEGPGAHLSLHDSTHSCPLQKKKGSGGEGGSGDGSGQGAAMSYEIRLVQELCDLGSLRDAFKSRRLRPGVNAPPGHVGVLVETALDVARALCHLHSHNIVHADLKARNVLLRSDASDPRGFRAKIADFGLSLTIDPHATHISNAWQGTPTHMAPETLIHGHVSKQSDVFAFGVLLYELFTGEHAYKGIPRALLAHKISVDGVRPVFPACVPFEWQFLACRCWESDPSIRPSMEQVLQELNRMHSKFAAAASASGSPGASGADASSSDALHPLSLLRLANAQQQQRRLPSIEDTSERLPGVQMQADEQQQQQQVPAAADAPGVTQSLRHAAVEGSVQHTDLLGEQPPQQQQHGPGTWFDEQARDAIVLLSGCDSTMEDLGPPGGGGSTRH